MGSPGTALVTVNGQPREFGEGITVADMLAELGLRPGMVVVEHNRRILERASLASTEVRTGDIFELVHFVGGGLIECRTFR
jgi:thiamine biosynthesis protein ThiS